MNTLGLGEKPLSVSLDIRGDRGDFVVKKFGHLYFLLLDYFNPRLVCVFKHTLTYGLNSLSEFNPRIISGIIHSQSATSSYESHTQTPPILAPHRHQSQAAQGQPEGLLRADQDE